MTLATDVMNVIDALVVLKSPEPDDVSKALKVPLAVDPDSTAMWERFEAHPAQGPFGRVRVQHRKGTKFGAVKLAARDGLDLKQSDLELTRFGPLAPPEINPQIPPEGTVSHKFTWDGGAFAMVFVFTTRTRKLTDVVLTWGPPKQPPTTK